MNLVPSVRVYLAGAVMAGLAAGGLLIAQAALLSRIVHGVLLQHDGLNAVLPVILLTAGVMVARAGLVGGREAAAGRAAVRAKEDIRRQLAPRFMSLGCDPSYGGSTADLVVAGTEGVEKLDAYLRRYLPQRILGVILPLAIAGAVFPVDPLSAVLLLFTAPVIVFLMILIGSFTRERVQQQWLTLERLGTSFLDVIQGLPTLLLLDRAENERERVVSISEQFRDSTLRVLRVAFLSGAVLELMSSVGIGLIATVLGVRLLEGGIPLDHAFYVFLLTPEFYRPLRDLGTSRHAALEGVSAAEQILGTLRTAPLPSTVAVSSHVPAGPISLELRQVSYQYPGRQAPALAEVDLVLVPNSCTALVGESGSGKTTLLNLLLRFLEPSSGECTVSGVPLRAIGPEEWRRHVALVPQSPRLFPGTVEDNIRLARPDARRREVEHAAELSGCAPFLTALPHGLETVIGEDGAGLSAGERQRIALARAFLKDTPLILLDEPTSALDPESEAKIRHALTVLRCDRSVLIVAHRLNTIREADRIVVLDRGRLSEVDSWAELLRTGGRYSALHRQPGMSEVGA